MTTPSISMAPRQTQWHTWGLIFQGYFKSKPNLSSFCHMSMFSLLVLKTSHFLHDSPGMSFLCFYTSYFFCFSKLISAPQQCQQKKSHRSRDLQWKTKLLSIRAPVYMYDMLYILYVQYVKLKWQFWWLLLNQTLIDWTKSCVKSISKLLFIKVVCPVNNSVLF